MLSSVRRILIGVLLAAPLVAATTVLLLQLHQVVSLVVMLVGIGPFMASETFRSRHAAAVGGWLVMSGLLAWALLAAKLVPAAG